MKLSLRSPLLTDWSEQYVRLGLPNVEPGRPLALTIGGTPTPFQYTGATTPAGAEILVRLGFAQGEEKLLEFTGAPRAETDLTRREVPLGSGTIIGVPGRELTIPPGVVSAEGVSGPLAGFAGFPLASAIRGDAALESAALHQINAGPLYVEHELSYRFAGERHYTLRLRCYQAEPFVEINEKFALGGDAHLELVLNPRDIFDSILSRDNFEAETQPVVEPLAMERPGDVLCRIQMPVLTEYSVPNNRGWFALFDSRNAARGMLGILGLYGAQWQYPVQNMMRVSVAGGRTVLRASLSGGERSWLLYAGPVQKVFGVQYSVFSGEEMPDGGTVAKQLGQDQGAGGSRSPRLNTECHAGAETLAEHRTLNTLPCDGRFVFHRLHAEFNALRLDEHLDLTGDQVHDGSSWNKPGIFGPGYRERARANSAALVPLRGVQHPTLAALLDPQPARQQMLRDDLFARFEKWVRQFQGWRTGEGDYAKNVIGFSRRLRGMLIAYELLRKDGALSEEQVRRLNAYFVFAARRILDEGRWPHSRTWLHPDHPESARDFYSYGGEHKPDRLVWTNSLPNFQSDPLCALAHLSALFPDHPAAARWQRFALDDIERQLNAYCGKSGAWEESIIYALYTFSYFVITFKALKERCGINYFEDERVRRFAGWLVRFLGPLDKRFQQYTWPGVGNVCCPTGGGEYLLCFAGELPEDDPLRADLLGVWQRLEPNCSPAEHYPVVMAAMAPTPKREHALRPLASEHMAELGVALRHAHPSPRESYLFQKIGFWKDHYENDESSFNWYAKGVPLAMDYGTYTFDVMPAAAHNLVEIPDMDPFRRGFLANHLFTPVVDFTHCEVPVTLKLLWGRGRNFEEVDNTDGRIERTQTPYFYIGDQNPVGPKVWKTRRLLFVKPDYIVLCDRVFGEVPHRFNLHTTADAVHRDGALIHAPGRFELDLLCHVQHPLAFDFQSGEFHPAPERYGSGPDNPHRQAFCRLYNRSDSLYRTVLFAREKDRSVTIASYGAAGVRITTAQYEDYVFLGEEWLSEKTGAVQFAGRAGWIRRESSGQVRACVPDGDQISAFGVTLAGRGPWTYNLDGSGRVELRGGPPRAVRVQI